MNDTDHLPNANANPNSVELADTELERVAAGKPYGFKAVGFKAVKGLVW